MTEERPLRHLRPVGSRSSALRKPYYNKSWALVIGINDYGDRHPPLANARNDAEAIAKTLQETYRFDDVFALYDNEATYGSILEWLKDELPTRTEPHDRLVFFFAGHGTTRESAAGYKRGYLIPHDAEPGKYSSFIDMSELRDACSWIPAKHILIVLDCCFSGVAAVASRATPPVTPGRLSDVYLQRITERPAWQVLTAGASDELAADSGVQPGHSAFTRALLAGLDGEADQNEDGFITATELANYVKPEVIRETATGGAQGQTPFFNYLVGSGQGDFVFQLIESPYRAAIPEASLYSFADVELHIAMDASNTLKFMLHSNIPEVGYSQEPMGRITLRAESPRAFIEGNFLERIDKISRISRSASRQDVQLRETEQQDMLRDLASVGEELFEHLFPPTLQRAYWHLKQLRDQGVIQSLLVITDEPWIPWELVKPYLYDEDLDEEKRSGYLAETFILCRWLGKRQPPSQINVTTASFITHPELETARWEVDHLGELATMGVGITAPLQRRDEVLELARVGGAQLVHLASHNEFDPEDADRSRLYLEDGRLLLKDLTRRRLRGLRESRPIVFLNADETARMGFGLTGLGGWPAKMIKDADVSALIGTLWPVDDRLAAQFAIHFYSQLFQKQSLGEAFQRARLHVHDLAPAAPTWLAYTLYGDPNCRLTFGRNA